MLITVRKRLHNGKLTTISNVSIAAGTRQNNRRMAADKYRYVLPGEYPYSSR